MTSASTKPVGEIDMATLRPTSRKAHDERADLEAKALGKVDGRTLRRRGRTETFSTKTTREIIETVQRIAQAEGVPMVEVFEEAIKAYDRALKGTR